MLPVVSLMKATTTNNRPTLRILPIPDFPVACS